MPFDPSNVCARTAAGDAELARPAKGLALAQRKLLAALDQPLILDELATRYGVENARLLRDLEHLAALGLVVVHGAGRSTSGSAARRTPTPVAAAAAAPVAPSRTAPRRRPSRSRRIVMLLLVAAIMATGIVLLGRSGAMPSVMGDASLPSSTPRVAVEPAAPSAVSPLPALSQAPASGPAPLAVPALADRPPVVDGAAVVASPARTTPAPAVPTLPVPATSPAAPAPPVATPPAPAAAASVAAPSAQVADPLPVAAEPSRAASTPEPVPVRPAPAPEPPTAPVVLAAASPSSPPAPRPLIPRSQEAPPFPREAIHAGTRQGTVRARLTLDAAGRVTSVAIVEAQPRRVFDRAVTTALASWTYEPGAPGRTTDVEVVFRRD